MRLQLAMPRLRRVCAAFATAEALLPAAQHLDLHPQVRAEADEAGGHERYGVCEQCGGVGRGVEQEHLAHRVLRTPRLPHGISAEAARITSAPKRRE